MSTTVYILPDGAGRPIPHAVKIRSGAEARKAYASRHPALWFALHAKGLRLLPGAIHQGNPRHVLLSVERLSASRRALMGALFSVVVEPASGMAILPVDELREVLASDACADLFVAARFVEGDDVLVLFRGDLRTLIVPAATFGRRPGGPVPDLRRVAITDYGQTVRLGSYEIAADALLYEFDPAARRRMKKRSLERDTSLGGSIRRLRLQRGLAREEFAPLNAKTLARIERGENTPRTASLALIAKRLGVKPGALGEY